MNGTFRIVGVLLLIVLALAGLSTFTASAQGPTGTETPTPVAPGTQTPAGAPPAAAVGTNQDNPLAAATLGNAIAALPTGGATWFKFNYDTLGNTFPRPNVVVRLINGVTNGLGFEIWSPERMQGNWFDNKPVGRGTAETLPNTNCIAGTGIPVDLSKNVDAFGNAIDSNTQISRCPTNDLTWVGGFGAPGAYYVRVINTGNNNVAPQLIISGAGIAECQTGALPQVAAQLQDQGTAGQAPQATQGTGTQGTQGQGFSIVQCQNPTQAQLLALSQSVAGVVQTSPPAAAPTVSPTETTAPAATATPAAPEATATAAVPLTTPTAEATPTTTTGGVTGTSTPAAAPTVGGLPECTPTPTPDGTTTPTATPTLAAGETPSPTSTPNCVTPGMSGGAATPAASPAAETPATSPTP